MQTSTVSDKYQVVIPSAIRKALSVKKGQKITWAFDKMSYYPLATVASEKIDCARALAGVGKGTWSKIDPQEYINKLRDEWEK
ncbi:AbrB/MazE/SpoVT family DNA-binding domain-containing protein [Candidatus Gottesmanbacteria bacterium]|nr:AbrB/MazE/SpoVT family DNA-binding domain-containing protein [Candidatus Gottesmanbacteria bacterium]